MENQQRAIIARDEFLLHCVKIGRALVTQLRQTLTENQTLLKSDAITDDELKELFAPLLKFVENETETRIEKEADELRGKMKEELSLQKNESRRNDIRDHFKNRVALNVNGRRSNEVHTIRTLKNLKKFVFDPKNQELVPEFKSAVFEHKPEVKNVEDLIKDPELWNQEIYSPFWLDYCPQIYVTVDRPGDFLLEPNFWTYLNYLKKRGVKFSNFTEIGQQMASFTVDEDFFGSGTLDEMLGLTKLCDAAVNRPLTPKELCKILPDFRESNMSNLRKVRYLIKYHRRTENKSDA